MPKIIFIESNGTQHVVDADIGITVMEAARDHSVPGIEAECGGACACATCHVHIEKKWLAVTGAAEGSERELLACTDDHTEASRLCCQIEITDDMEGLIVKIPEGQGF